MKTFKVIVMGTLLAMASILPVAAQRGCGGQGERGNGNGKQLTAEQHAQKQTEKMDVILELTPAQKEQVQALNLKYAQEREAERKAMQEARQKHRDSKESELKRILTPAQYEKHQAMRPDCPRGKK